MTAPSPTRLAVIRTGPLILSFLSSGEVISNIPGKRAVEEFRTGPLESREKLPLTRMFFHIQRKSRGQIEKSSTTKAQSLETAQLHIGRNRDGSFPPPPTWREGLRRAWTVSANSKHRVSLSSARPSRASSTSPCCGR